MSREDFSEYVRRVMKQKGLNATDVERNSGNKIDRSHVGKFMRGVEKNPSASVMMALAAGLGVNGVEVFIAVTGCAPEEEKPDVMKFLNLMEQVAMESELVDAVQALMSLPPSGRVAIMKALTLHKGTRQSEVGKRSNSKKRKH